MSSEDPARGVGVSVAGRVVPLSDALNVVAGYCLGERPAPWKRHAGGVGPPLTPRSSGLFAYRTYDCVRAGPTHQLEPIDILVADGLNAQMRSKHIAGVLAVADEVSAELMAIDERKIVFWELSRGDVSTPPPNASSPAWPIWRAWTILMGVGGIDIARAHKILHHKRPTAFPLLDNRTIGCLNLEGSSWAAIHRDLTTNGDGWAQLEDETARVLAAAAGPPLARLRLHDILIWTLATNQWDVAMGHGQLSS